MKTRRGCGGARIVETETDRGWRYRAECSCGWSSNYATSDRTRQEKRLRQHLHIGAPRRGPRRLHPAPVRCAASRVVAALHPRGAGSRFGAGALPDSSALRPAARQRGRRVGRGHTSADAATDHRSVTQLPLRLESCPSDRCLFLATVPRTGRRRAFAAGHAHLWPWMGPLGFGRRAVIVHYRRCAAWSCDGTDPPATSSRPSA